MNKIHNLQSADADENHLFLFIDDNAYRIRWEKCSPKLARANLAQRRRMEVAPSGYGIHWPELDEDLAITPLLKHVEVLEMAAAS